MYQSLKNNDFITRKILTQSLKDTNSKLPNWAKIILFYGPKYYLGILIDYGWENIWWKPKIRYYHKDNHFRIGWICLAVSIIPRKIK